MPSYKLTWTIDAEGDDALDAVRRTATDYFLAAIAQGREGSACVFEVTDQEGQTQTLDLADHRIHLECAHADTCLPSFWQGHHLAHIQVAVWNGMTFGALKAALRSELNQGAVIGADYPGEHNDQWFAGAVAAVNAMTLNEGTDPQHLFKTLEVNDDEGETVYAFFVFTPIEAPEADDEPDHEMLDSQTPVCIQTSTKKAQPMKNPITPEQLAEAQKLMDEEGPVQGMMRIAYRCDECSRVFMHRFIPYGLGRGHRFNLCMCQLTANRMHNATVVLEMRDHEAKPESTGQQALLTDPVSLAAHAKILSAYLHRLTVADVEAMLEAVKDSHHAGANLGTYSQVACHTALELVVAECLSSKLAYDLDNVASIIHRSLDSSP